MGESFHPARRAGKPWVAARTGTAYHGRVRVAAIASVLLLGGCLPDLSAWEVVAGRADGGNRPGEDAGTGQPNPLDLGPPCPSPHLLLGTIASSSTTARVLRLDPATSAMCRTSELLEVQRAYGSSVADVEWHPETGALLGLSDAVLGLDGEGFPRWRHEPFGYVSFRGEWLAAFGSGSSLRVAVAWSERSSSFDSMLLLDAQGHRTSGDITPPFFGAMIAAHPDGSGRLLIPSRAGADLDVYSVDDASTNVHDSTGTPLWTGGADLPATYGNRTHLATDLSRRLLVITHERGIAFWTAGTSPPADAIACPSYCATFHASAPDPSDGAYSICNASGTSTRHLVRVRSGGCELVIDGTSLGSHRLQDVTLVRAAL